MTLQDPHDLDLCTILFTAVAYVVSDVDYLLPDSGKLQVSSGTVAAAGPLLMITALVMTILHVKGI